MQNAERVTDGVYWYRTLIANVCFVTGDSGWVLVDAGVRGYAGSIRRIAAHLFGAARPPQAIVLTHAHFDHVGSLKRAAQRVGRTRLRPPAGAALPDGPILVSAARPARRRRGDGVAGEALPPQPNRPRWTRAGLAIGRIGSRTRWVAVARHTGAHGGPRVTAAAARPRGDRGRRRHHDPAGIVLGRGHAAARAARATRVLHAELVRSRAVGAHARRHRAARARDGSRPADERTRDARRSPPARRPVRNRRVAQARPLRARPAQADERGTVWVPPDPLPRHSCAWPRRSPSELRP
jgi:hypothetical protein